MASSVEKSRFKIFPVKSQKCTIKTLVELNHLPFKKGRGFYQLNKPELIQEYKEVIIRRKEDGAIITGDKVREMLKIPKSSKKFKIDLTEISDFDVFIQSTSVNRVLLPGTDFLYEADESTTDTAVEPKVVSARGSKRKAVSGPTETTPKKKVKVAATTVVRETRVSKRSSAKAKPVEEEKEPTTSVKRKTVSKSLSAKAKPVGKKESAALPLKRKSATDSEAAEDIEDGAVLPKKAKLTATPSDGPVEIVFSFDTTGSMYPCLTQVRRKVSDTVKRLTREIPGIRIAVIAHGDYCDSYTYVTKILDFTQDEAKICSFVENVESTGGGDWEECYELVIYEARTKLSWTPGTQRSLVMIGDAIPHPTTYSMNTLKLDWKKEAKQLYNDIGCRIYSVQALNNTMSNSFYRGLADLTCGYHLCLDQFSSIIHFIMAICFREQSLDQLQVYEDEVRSKGTGVNRSLHRLFDTLTGRGETVYSGGNVSDELTPVDPARFQVLDVDQRQDIKTYVQKNGLIFKMGRGFYEFTKAEKISDKKEVVLVDKVTGDMFTGPEASRVIGAGDSGKIKPTSLDKWRVFVQSTSYNRVLMPNTGFLYEVDPEH